MASTNYNGTAPLSGTVFGSLSGDRLGGDLQGDSYVQSIATARQPLIRYVTHGQFGGATEVWTDSFVPTTPPPSQHVTTETSHTKSVG